MFPRSRNGKAPVIEKFLDSKNVFDVLPFIYTMPGLGFFGGKIGEFSLPETEDIRLDSDDLADFRNLEEELIWNLCRHKTKALIH
jgi:hypothetical protein